MRKFFLESERLYFSTWEQTDYGLAKELWGKGIGTEALNTVIEYAFKKLKVENLFAGHNPKNIASKKLLTKVGFKFVREEYYAPTGLMHPSYLYKKE